MKIRFSLFIVLTFMFCQLSAQNSVFTVKKTLNWSATPEIYDPLGISQKKFWVFEGSAQHPTNPVLPVVHFRFPISGKGVLTPVINNPTCLLYTSPSPRDLSTSRMPSSA